MQFGGSQPPSKELQPEYSFPHVPHLLCDHVTTVRPGQGWGPCLPLSTLSSLPCSMPREAGPCGQRLLGSLAGWFKHHGFQPTGRLGRRERWQQRECGLCHPLTHFGATGLAGVVFCHYESFCWMSQGCALSALSGWRNTISSRDHIKPNGDKGCPLLLVPACLACLSSLIQVLRNSV